MGNGLIIIFLLFSVEILADEIAAPASMIPNGSFEDWEWVPLDSDAPVLSEARKRLKNGENANIDYRGPLFHRLVGYSASLGRIVEGADAYQGKSLLLENDWKDGSWNIVGFYSAFNALLESGKEYDWEVWLKGKGDFVFKAWIGGRKSGQFKWLGFPDLIQVSVTDQWQVYRGRFKVPLLEEGDSRQDRKVSAAIVVKTGCSIYVDNFMLWPAGNNNLPAK